MQLANNLAGLKDRGKCLYRNRISSPISSITGDDILLVAFSLIDLYI